jgi:hypothetical protein
MTNHRQPDGAPPGWQEAFLGHLRETGNVSAAARAAGTCRSRCYEWRRRDPAFVAEWADALEEAADRLEMEAFRRAEVTALQNEALALALERERLVAQAAIVSAEAGGASWLQRNWRPIPMLSFLGLVIADAFGMLAFRLADQAWLLLQIGLGGYVVGRSVEKISPQIANGGPYAPPYAPPHDGTASSSKSSSRPSAKPERRSSAGAGASASARASAGAGVPKARGARDAGPR